MQRTKRQLVRNEAATKQFQSITMNLSPTWKYDTLEGRQHMVVPMIMLAEGVHAGSAGPLFYSGAEITRSAEDWNHFPIVVYHPQRNGAGISARDVDVLNSQKIGIILNSRVEDGKLRAEAWLERPRIQKVDSRILDKLDARETVELSTGLYTDNDGIEGEWNGEKFSGTVSNFRPDHLAILPDQKGAFSVADGAGLLRNKEIIMKKTELVTKLIANSTWEESDREFLESLTEPQLKKIEVVPPVVNEDPAPKKKEKKIEVVPPKEAKIIKMPLANQDDPPKKLTVNEYIDTAPPEIKDMLRTALRSLRVTKASFVNAILDNANNMFTEDQLESKDLGELECIANLAQVQVAPAQSAPTYAGLEGAFSTVRNTQGTTTKAPKPLGLPEMKF